MFENPRRGRQARNFTTNVPKILDLKSSSEQIFSRKFRLGAPDPLKSNPSKYKVKLYQNRSNLSNIFCPILSSEFLVKFNGKFRSLSLKSNYYRSKTINRKTTKNYHPRAEDPLLLIICSHVSIEALKRG